MAKSIISNDRFCIVCGSPYVEKHHVYGASNRSLSEKWGCWCYLCKEHHTGNTGVHFNKEFRDQLQMATQMAFEVQFPNEDFMKIFGKNYI